MWSVDLDEGVGMCGCVCERVCFVIVGGAIACESRFADQKE